MSFLTMPITWFAGAAETTVRYVASQLPIISSKPTHGGQEAVFLLKQPWQWLSTECIGLEACKRASERTFVPYYTAASKFAGKYTVLATDFLAKNLDGVWLAGSVAKGADNIAKWAVRDYYNEGTGLQTIFSLAIIGYAGVTGVSNLVKCYSNLKPDYKRQTYIAAALYRLALAAVAGCVVWGELQALSSRAH